MTTNDYFEAALGAERWIASHARKTEHGLAWGLANEAADRTVRTLYAGSAGIALYYLELYEATGESRYLENARQAGNDITAYLEGKEKLTPSCLGGWGGYLFALHEIAKATGDSRFTDVARFCAERLIAQSSEIGAGIGWIDRMPYTREEGLREIYDVAEGAAGIGLYYLYAHEEGVHEDALAWVRLIANRLL